ncbi:MAG: putative transposase [Sphingomonadales bacterium]|jgi:transposase InsO family protein|nr:putative transposase [Sphingomonadales bacterium]
MIAEGGTHFSAAQLASLALPGLPKSKRGVQFLADRERWSWIERQGRGGGRLYSVLDLPEAARLALQQRRERLVPANLRPVGRPRGSDFFTKNPAVADAVEAILANRQLSAPRLLELLAQRFTIAEIPTRRTLARFIQKLEEQKAALLASTRNPDLYKSRFKLALGRADGGAEYAHQVWELDTTKVDVLTKGGRKMVFGVIDRYSRRARFMVGESESGQAVRRLLVETIQAWGVVPEMIATDNGCGYINKSIVTALETLGIRHWRCPPGTPEKKPFVERLFGTFTRERAALLGGFAGHNVAQAQQLRSKAKKETGRAVIVPELEPAELQAILDAWVDGVYHRREHSGIRTTPMQRWLASPVPARAAPAEEVLKMALSAYVGAFKVGKRGVQWKRGRYWAPALAPFIGRMVIVRRDEEDLGALFIFDEDGHYIDTAVNHERAGLSEEQFAREAARHQRTFMNAARAELRGKQARFRFEDARDGVLRRDAEEAGKLITLPPSTRSGSTPQLDSLARQPAPVLPSAARLEEAERRLAPRKSSREPTPKERVAWADRIIEADRLGAAVDADELKRARLFAQSTAYKAEKLISGHFGTAPAQTPMFNRRHSA